MTSTSRDTRQPARSRTQVRLRVNFGSLGNYGAPRRPRWRRPPTRVGDSFRRKTVRVGPLRSRDGLGSTSWLSPIGPTSTVAVDIGATAESWALRPAARGSHRGRLGLLERRLPWRRVLLPNRPAARPRLDPPGRRRRALERDHGQLTDTSDCIMEPRSPTGAPPRSPPDAAVPIRRS